MKTKSFIAMSMIAALAAGCSSDDIVDGVEDTNGGTEVTTSGTAFVSLNIMLPNTAGTRADSQNEQFENGDPDEYKVNSLEITFYSAVNGDFLQTVEYNASDLYWDNPAYSTGGITTKAVLPVVQVDFIGEAWAVVAVNKPTGWTVGVDNEAQTGVTASTITGTGKKNFFMTNAVKHDGTFLVKVKSFTSKNEAQKYGETCDIYVERAAAKVNLYVDKVNNLTDWSSENVYKIPEGKTNAGAQVKIANWQLDVTNTTMYPIRKFIGTNPTKPFNKDVYTRFYGVSEYRTYWAEDPNYDTDGTFNTIKFGENIKNEVGDCEYCLENTFDVKHQKQNQTTRVLVKAVYAPNGMALNTTWYTLGNSAKELSATDVENKIAAELQTVATDIELNGEMAAGTRYFTTTSFKVNGSEPTPEQVNKVNSRFGKITTYKDGVCYYAIRIKHLDYYCPWGDEKTPNFVANAPVYNVKLSTAGEDDPTEPTKYVDYVHYTTKDVPGFDVSYLGRYGVVRNNWYKVTIKTIAQPGSPIIPELTEDPDDEQKYYLQATINILDWAVRNQGVDL